MHGPERRNIGKISCPFYSGTITTLINLSPLIRVLLIYFRHGCLMDWSVCRGGWGGQHELGQVCAVKEH